MPLILFFYSCGAPTKTDNITASQRELFSYLPENTEYLFYADLKEIQKSEYIEEYLTALLKESYASGWVIRFEKAVGTEIKNVITEVVLANTRDDEGILLVRFDNGIDRIKKYFNESPDFLEASNKKIYSLKSGPGHSIYFPGGKIVIAIIKGNYLDSLADNCGKRLKSNEQLISVIENIKSKHTIWMATDKGSFASGIFDRIAGKDSKLLSPGILSSIKDFSVSAKIRGGAQIESVLGCSNAGSAYLLAAAVESAAAMNILSQKNYKLGKIFNKMYINREGKLIRFHLNINDKELDEIKYLARLDNRGNNSKGEIW